MANPAALPNISLPFSLPLNFSSIYQDYFEPLNISLPLDLNISSLNPLLENFPLSPWKPASRDPTDWLTDGATLGLLAALIQMIAGAGFDSLQDGGITDLSSKRRVDDIDGGLSLEMKIEEYLRRKNAKKQGLFNDEIDFGSDYYEDFDIEDAEDRDNLNSYDYSDFIANNDPGVYQGGNTGEEESQRRKLIARQQMLVHQQQLLMAKKQQQQFFVAQKRKQQQMFAAKLQQQQQQQQQQLQARAALAQRLLTLSRKATMAKSRSQGRVGIVRPRVRVVSGYLRPKAPLLAYIRPALANRIYDVAYPYGVGGDTLLDRIAVDFDPWLTSVVIGYFFNRFVASPFGIPSITDLLGQAVGAVGKRDVDGRRRKF